MKKLFVKLFRDIWQTIGQFVSILLVIAVGCFFFAGMISSTGAIDNMIDDFYKEQNMADYWAYYYNASEETLEEIRNNEKVNYAESRFSIVVPHKIARGEDGAIIETKIELETMLENINKPMLYGDDSKLPTFTKIPVVDGVPDVNFQNEAILDRVYATQNNIKVGDVVTLKVKMAGDFLMMVNQGGLFDGLEEKDVEATVPFKITGLFDSPEYLYRTNESGQNVERHKLGYMQIPEETFLNVGKVVFYEMCTHLNEVPETIMNGILAKTKAEIFSTPNIFSLYPNLKDIKMELDSSDEENCGKILFGGGKLHFNVSLLGDNGVVLTPVTMPLEITISNENEEKTFPSILSTLTKDKIGRMEILVDAKDGATMEEIFGEKKTDITSNKNAKEGDFLFAFSLENQQSAAAFDATYSQISNLVSVFPLIFFMVAAIITFISMSKMVENQRMQIGIMQALGIRKGHIYVSYLGYAFLAAFIGSILGGLFGILLLPKIYYGIFEYQFVLPPLELHPSWIFLGIGVLVSLVVSCLSALVSCNKTLREIPASALRPKPPKKTKKIFLERWTGFWKRLSFKTKIIIRNIFLNKTRILLSSFGVIGCVTLLIAGCGIKQKIDKTLDTYFGSMNYDISIKYDKENLLLEDLTAADSNIKEFVEFTNVGATYVSGDEGREAERISLTAIFKKQDYINITNMKGEKIKFTNNTVAIPFSFAEDNNIEVGDDITLSYTDDNGKSSTCVIKVTDISEQYGLTTIYISNEMFTTINNQNGVTIAENQAYIRLNDTSKYNESVAKLSEEEFIDASFSSEEMKITVSKMLFILDIIVVIIVVGAAVLAMTVIYNITSINVFERRRELATLKVLGCYKYELNHLVMAENMVITAIGCIIGLPIGWLLYDYLIKVIGTMQFTLTASLSIWVVLISFAVTFVFSILATIFLNRKMQKIDMVEALKGAE